MCFIAMMFPGKIFRKKSVTKKLNVSYNPGSTSDHPPGLNLNFPNSILLLFAVFCSINIGMSWDEPQNHWQGAIRADYLKSLEPIATRKCSEKFLEIVSKLLVGGI